MGYIFDRLENLLKSSLNKSETNPMGSPPGQSSNPDYNDAMDELDELLNRNKTSSEAKDSAARLRREQEARYQSRHEQPRTDSGTQGRIPESLRADFSNLEVPFGTSFPEVKKSYKRLLKLHHPDRHAGETEALRRATVKSAKINASYQRIETWTTTGKVD